MDRGNRGRSTESAQRLTALVVVDPLQTADAAGLEYVTDEMPGIRRVRRGKGWSYIGPDGRPVRDPQELRRIRSLAIPPAWVEVWICPLANGHLQATGRDAKGRKQYRYHAQWAEQRSRIKYDRMLLFGLALPDIRAQVERDLAWQGLPREKVLAAVVRLLETTFIRVGNPEYVRANRSFGLTTLRDRHVEISGSHLQFHFRGKSGLRHEIDVRDRRLARIVKQCRDVPGYDLFQYLDDSGQRQALRSDDVNAYLRQLTGQDFTAKDFRTWGGTVLALRELRDMGPCSSTSQGKHGVAQAVGRVANQLGNRPATCRKYYVHPAVIDAYLDGTLQAACEQGEAQAEPAGLSAEERAVLALLLSGEDRDEG